MERSGQSSEAVCCFVGFDSRKPPVSSGVTSSWETDKKEEGGGRGGVERREGSGEEGDRGKAPTAAEAEEEPVSFRNTSCTARRCDTCESCEILLPRNAGVNEEENEEEEDEEDEG